MGQWVRELAALAKDLVSVPSTTQGCTIIYNFGYRACTLFWHCIHMVYRQACWQNTYTQKNKNKWIFLKCPSNLEWMDLSIQWTFFSAMREWVLMYMLHERTSEKYAKPGMLAHLLFPVLQRLRKENYNFEASFPYLSRPHLKISKDYGHSLCICKTLGSIPNNMHAEKKRTWCRPKESTQGTSQQLLRAGVGRDGDTGLRAKERTGPL